MEVLACGGDSEDSSSSGVEESTKKEASTVPSSGPEPPEASAGPVRSDRYTTDSSIRELGRALLKEIELRKKDF